MAIFRSLLSLTLMASILIELTMAVTHSVGGSSGSWDSSTDLQTWTSSQTFSVGDSLSFQYTPNHDVTEVSKSNYDACSASKPIKVYTDGSTTIPLSTPGKRYFICGTQGHCLQGMKIEVNVLATTTSPPSSAPKASPPSSSPKSSPPSSSPSGSPQSAPTTPSPSSSESPEANGPSSELSPTAPTTQTPESSPAPSAASANYEGSFRAGIVVVFGAFLMLLAF